MVRQIKQAVKDIKPVRWPLDQEYKIIKTDGSKEGWGAVLKLRPYKEAYNKDEETSLNTSGNFKRIGMNWTSPDFEIEAVNQALNHFKIFLDKPFTIRTDCEAIVKFINNDNSTKFKNKRWVNFVYNIQGNGYNITFEHIKGKDNKLADMLSRKLTSYFAGNEQ